MLIYLLALAVFLVAGLLAYGAVALLHLHGTALILLVTLIRAGWGRCGGGHPGHSFPRQEAPAQGEEVSGDGEGAVKSTFS